MAVTVSGVVPGSIAAKKRVLPGDILLAVNGKEIEDVLDYRFHLQNSRLTLTVKTAAGKVRQIRIKKEEQEELGLEFDTYLMDQQKSCRNKCIFCFIDQLPEGMRESLYFKDDDSRLSFLFGNYITLTNLTEHEIERIIDMHISPINISVHTTDPLLRCKMMNNRFAGESLQVLKRFADAGLQIQCQLVLCPGYNDGEQLQKSMEDLAALYPAVTSVAAVPVGLTKFRDGLTPLRPFTKEECVDTIRRMQEMGDRMMSQHGTRVFYPSDEWFIRAELPIPGADFYEEFAQLENGVGMISLLTDEFIDALEQTDKTPKGSKMVVATGVDAAPFLQNLIDEAKKKWDNISVDVVPVKNEFFGENITVAGLLTGQDIVAAVKGMQMEYLLLSENTLRQQGDCFLDDMTPAQMEEIVGVPVKFISDAGADLLETILL
jgi:putative radical SAM enzyme (TIGR03279 family)